jgi:phospholipase/lecithinase/hemolysin
MRYSRTMATVLALGLALGACSSSSGDAEVEAAPAAGPAPDAAAPPPPAEGGAPPPDDGGTTPPDDGATPPEDPVAAISALFVLGDSLSDVGNAAAMFDSLLNLLIEPPTVGLCNPADVLVAPRRCDDLFYRQSRVSDGPTAVEHVAAHLGLDELAPSLHLLPGRSAEGTNYAVSTAKAGSQADEDLSRQVDMLLLDHGLQLPADALYVVMIGGNDAIDALQAAFAGTQDAPETSAAIVTAAVVGVAANVERLIDYGARRLVVANVPDLAALPAVRARAAAIGDEAVVLAAASAIAEAFDHELGVLLDGIESEGRWPAPVPLEIVRFDLRAALWAAQDTAAAGGGNELDACFDSDVYRDSQMASRIFHPDCAPGQDEPPRFTDFVFWDGIHPTGAAHAAIGAALIELL